MTRTNAPVATAPYAEVGQMRITALLAAALTGLCLSAVPAWAIPIDSNLAISASVTLDATSSSATGNGDENASYSLVSGGVSSSAAVDKTLATTSGTLPRSGSLTQLNDGVGVNARMNGSFQGGTAATTDGLFSDYAFSFQNNSATDDFKITLAFVFANSANADGPATPPDGGAFIFSAISLTDASNTELFFSDLRSDTLFGDFKNGVALGTFGQSLTDNGPSSLDITVAHGTTVTLSATQDLRGGAFEAGALYDGSLDAFISVAGVQNLAQGPPSVPEPGTLLLAGGGLFGLMVGRRRSAARIGTSF